MKYIHEEYDKFIQNIINTRGQWGIPEGEYYESHHIIPKCFGGLPVNCKVHNLKHPNIIWLYPQEHYEAHKLLFEENPTNYKLWQSWWRTAYDKCGNYIPCERYAELKLSSIKFSDEHRYKLSISHKGIKQSDDLILKRIKHQFKRVRCVETGEIFNSYTEAANSKHTYPGHIGWCCMGKRKTAGGFHWESI